MFLRRTRGLLDLLLASLCLWGACYQTPVGAALRGGVGVVIGREPSVSTVLSYYNGGVYTPEVLGKELPPLPVAVTVTESEALGLGVFSIWSTLSLEQRLRAGELIRQQGLDPSALRDPRAGPRALSRTLQKLKGKLGSEDAAVLALLCGEEPARYAAERVRAEGGVPDLVSIVRHLPPGFDEEVATTSRALMLGCAYALSWPVARTSPVTSGFGSRTHPLLGEPRLHKGIDISLAEGTPIRAAGEGVVLQSGRDGVNGVWISLDHGRGVTTAYLHVARAHVGRGDFVRRGQRIADSGRTGLATGPHLHYQLELARVPVDPLRFSNGSTGAR